MFTLRIVLLSLVIATGCKDGPTEQPATATQPATQPAASSAASSPGNPRALIANGAVVLDVRTPDEFSDEHHPSAANIPVDEVSHRLDEVAKLTGGDKTKPIVVYCRSGARAVRAIETLAAAGYTQVVNGKNLRALQ